MLLLLVLKKLLALLLLLPLLVLVLLLLLVRGAVAGLRREPLRLPAAAAKESTQRCEALALTESPLGQPGRSAAQVGGCEAWSGGGGGAAAA